MSAVQPNISDELARRHRTTQVIVFGIAATIIAILAFTLIGTNVFADSPLANPSLAIALRMAIGMLAVIVIMIRRSRFNPQRLSEVFKARGASGVLTQLQTTTILIAALAEAIAILGLVNAFADASSYQGIIASAIALAMLLCTFPRRASWQRVIEFMQQKAV